MFFSTGGTVHHARALFSRSAGGLLSPNVCVRKIIVGNDVVDGHLDTCATHCFVSSKRSLSLIASGFPVIRIKPFPVGQGNPLPDATQAHLAPLWLITQEGQLTGFGTVLFLVSNTGADILIANNILDFLGILRYRPPIGYEQALETEVKKLYIPIEQRLPPWDINPETFDNMISRGQCLFTEATEIEGIPLLPLDTCPQPLVIDIDEAKLPKSFKPRILSVPIQEQVEAGIEELIQDGVIERIKPATVASLPTSRAEFPLNCQKCGKHLERCECDLPRQSASKQDELGRVREWKEHPHPPLLPVVTSKGTQENRQEIRRQKIQEANELQVGKEPPMKKEILDALDLLKRIAESSPEKVCTQSDVEEWQKELSKGRPEWAQCLTTANLQTPEEAQWAKTEIEEMMDGKFKDTVFGKTLKTPCSFQPFEIKVKPGSAPERAIQPRRYKDPAITKLIDDWVESLLKDDLIRESQTPVAAPVTVVLKKGREPRVCIDYRERNARTDTPIYPMPDVHDFLDEAAGFKFYCSFDCTKMFNQYEIVEQHRYLAAFMTQNGTYEPNRIMFGVTGGPQHAVRSARPALKTHGKTNGTIFTEWAIEQNQKGEIPPYEIDPRTGIVPGSRLDMFIDDCRIPQNKLKGMVKLCELWFEFCEEHHLVLSRKKTKLCLTHLPFLGFIVSAKGKHLDPSRIASLLEAPIPSSREGLHALLCSYNFVRMFITDFSVLAAPLYAATRGIIWKGPGSGRSKGTRDVDPEFEWTENLDRSLRQLQSSLLSAPILTCPDYNKPIFLSVDACLKGEGWVLWQILEGRNGSTIPIVIQYGSTKYDEAESTWEVTRQEAHAIQSALKNLHDYIFSCHFYLLTDHRNLTFLSASVNRAVIRIRHYMQQFNMTIVHVPGIWNNPADGISRLDPENLPVAVASDLITATTVQALEGFSITNRGTNPIVFDFEEGDRIVEVSSDPARAFFTAGERQQPGCPWEGCILCNPTLPAAEDNTESHCFFSSSQLNRPELSDDSDSECSDEDPLDWEQDGDLVEHLHLQITDAKVLLTRAQARKEAEEWNNKQNIEKSRSLIRDPLCSEESEWIPDMADSRSRKTIEVSKAWELPARLEPQIFGVGPSALPTATVDPSTDGNEGGSDLPPIPEPLAASLSARKVIEIITQGTQTTPADFRATQIHSPFEDDFRAIHNDEEGHHGIDHSYRKLMVKCGSKWAEEKGTATNVRNSLKNFIKNCPTCQKVRGLQDKIKSKHSFICSRPFTEVSYDFIVFEKPDRNGNRYLIVVVDNFTKLVEMKAVPDRGAEGVARFLLEIKARYGPINRLRSDREKAFTSLVITQLNELTGTSTLPCIAYHPEANSICERQNQIIMNHLRALVYGSKLGTDSMYAWSDLIPFVYSIVNNTPKLPLAISPLSLVYGIFANYDRPLLNPRQSEGLANPVDYVDGLVEWQTRLLELAEGIQSQYFEKFALKNKDYRTFQEGDFVLQLKNSTGARGKLITRWLGPRLVLARRNNDPMHPVLDLYDLVTSKKIEASIDDCRLFQTGWFEEPTMLQDLHKLAALDKEEYEVELILEHRPTGFRRSPKIKTSDYWFKVKWAGFSDEQNSWEPYSALKGLLPLDEYLDRYPELNFLKSELSPAVHV